MKKVFIGIDNGVSGSIGIISPSTVYFGKTPTFVQQDFQKKKKNITRVAHSELYELLRLHTYGFKASEIMVAIERPMINPQRYTATISAVRAWESTLITLESLGLPYQVVDSKEWQKKVLPQGVKGSPELKKASLDVGNRLFPQFKENKHEDRDGMLIAEYLRLINVN